MKKLSDDDLKRIARAIIRREPYKAEFDNNYYRNIAIDMLVKAMREAIDLADQQDGTP